MKIEDFKKLINRVRRISEGEVISGPWEEKPPVVAIDDSSDDSSDPEIEQHSFINYGKECQKLIKAGVKFYKLPDSFHTLLSSNYKLHGNAAIWQIQKILNRELKVYELSDILESYLNSPYPNLQYKNKPDAETFILNVSKPLPIHDIFIIPAGTRFLCNSPINLNYILFWAPIE